MGDEYKDVEVGILLRLYKQPEIQKEIVESAEDKEVAVKFGERGFGKRPDVLQYPSDILELAKQRATSFHCSEELWKNPLQLDPMMRKQDVEELRKGWDLVIDIDCPFLDYSKIAADLIVKALKHHSVNAVSVKFSGNHGFHIAVPFESFPDKVHETETKLLFPEGARKIALYLKEMIKNHLRKALLAQEDIDVIKKKTGKPFSELVPDGEFDPFSVLSIDTLLISSRHLYRAPYSLNEKSGLVSIPIDPSKILEFDKSNAEPDKVKISSFKFLDRSVAKKGEGKNLIVSAFDFKPSIEEEEIKVRKEYVIPEEAVPEDLFPPCIKLIFKGLRDGKKRSLFVLVNFLVSCGWSYEQIETKLKEWNKKNGEMIKEVLIVGQLRYHKQQKKKILPPNCNNSMYYKDFGVCKPDNLCGKIKNPVQYCRRKVWGKKK
ncbi:hypothetical protein ACFLZ7_00025 [Nanoarchaeota archaeon]